MPGGRRTSSATMKILVLLLCANSVLCAELPDLPFGEGSDPLLSYLEKTYNTGRVIPTSDGGSPLLLTPFIEKGMLKEAREAAYVDPTVLVPDMDSYSGYLTVNKKYNSNLWFWYFPVADKSVEETPWILWLQGGPGASSMLGLFTEIGPFFVTEDNNELTLEEIKYSWGKNHSLLFIDNPVGTGYSFTEDDRGFSTNQTTIGENLYSGLQQFLTIFPELRKAPLTVAGGSYAGKHIPSLGVQIHWNKEHDEPINLQGLAIGNGAIDPINDSNHSYIARAVGLVDDKTADRMQLLETLTAKFINNGNFLKAYVSYSLLVGLLVLESRRENIYNFLSDEEHTLDGPYIDYIQRGEVRKALHVGNTNFTTLGIPYVKLLPDIMTTAKPWLEELLDNYRVMLYNGHLDVSVPYFASMNTYNSLSFSGTDKFKTANRKPWYHDGKLAGYYKIADNLTEVMVRGAGHMVPTDQPSAALGMISAFARGIPLDKDTSYLMDVEEKSLRKRRLPK